MWSCFIFFFFKQKTAYEMRISDWSSDVCSSDLQLASSPAIAVLTSGELAIVRPIRSALSSLAAPLTNMVMNLLAPSPSRTTDCASWRHKSASAAAKASAPGSSKPVSGALAALPAAQASTVLLEIGRESGWERVGPYV